MPDFSLLAGVRGYTCGMARRVIYSEHTLFERLIFILKGDLK